MAAVRDARELTDGSPGRVAAISPMRGAARVSAPGAVEIAGGDAAAAPRIDKLSSEGHLPGARLMRIIGQC